MTRQDLTLLVPRSWWPQRRRRGRGRYGLVVGIVLSALALSGCFGPGYYSVGHPLTSRQLPPGLWRSLGGDGCSWTRVQPGSPSSAGTSTHTRGPQYVHIAPSDKGFVTSNCFPFWQEPGVYARPVTTPGSPFGDGDFLVGYEVMPGTYVASVPAGQTCSWAVVRGFHGNNAAGRNQDFVRGDSTRTSAPRAVIEPGDYGFTSQGCGQWQPVLTATRGPGWRRGVRPRDRRRGRGLPRPVRAADRRSGRVRRDPDLLLRVLDRIGVPRAHQRPGGALRTISSRGSGVGPT